MNIHLNIIIITKFSFVVVDFYFIFFFLWGRGGIIQLGVGIENVSGLLITFSF